MNTHFAALHHLAASNVCLRAPKTVPEEDYTFQWYVSEIDRFIVSVNVKNLRDTFSLLNVSEESWNKLNIWLNEFIIIWNRWRGDIHSSFSEVYRLATERSSIVEKWFDCAIKKLEKLKETPEDESLKEEFTSYLSSLNHKLSPIQDEIKLLINNMEIFINSFDRQQKILTDLCVQACKEEGVKKEQIKDIEDIISDYEDNIAELKRSIIMLGIIDGLGILGTIGAIVGSFFTGGLTLALLVPCLPIVGCTSYMIAKFKLEIDQLNDKIEEKKKAITVLNDDIIGLIAFDKMVKGFSEKSCIIKEYVIKAKQPWDALSEDLNRIFADISVLDNTSSSIYADYLVSFKDAKALWTGTFMPGIQQLKLEEIKVVNTPKDFVINKTEDWEEAVRKYSVSIDEYFSSKSA
ncbi:hypothetical protein K0G05_14470 [Phocaeicola vulgatus]|uniref:hypothetical protein n=1 Tax=Phocaeicola vulgatus TaxID=821 RepID=UPI001F15EA47|nr:hypothetical protein [Phocaeicola vulgatus]MCE8956697.1 hypothetical protein [Phocaeicola vulgatus]